HDSGAAVALQGGGEREADAGIAGGGLDDRPAGPEPALPLGSLDHREADAVLHRAARVEILELRHDARAAGRGEPLEPHDRGVSHELEDGGVLPRHRREAYATQRRRRQAWTSPGSAEGTSAAGPRRPGAQPAP